MSLNACLKLSQRRSQFFVLAVFPVIVHFALATAFAAEVDDVWIPLEVSKCLQRAGLDESRVMTGQNPLYLRGDFDADGKPDHAVGVRGQATTDNGVLICNSTGHIASLGRTGLKMASSISGLANNVFPAHWQVLQRSSALAERKQDPTLPPILTGIQGEAISLLWRDEVALVYWDGKRYRFSGIYQ